MATKLEIINTALSYLGNVQVNTLDISNPVIQAMSTIYDTMKPDELAGHPWHFALTWKTLDQDPATPDDPRFNFAYYLPVDYVQAWNTYPAGNYEIITEKTIYSNINPPWKWLYVANVDEGLYPSYFSKLMALSLAAESAMLVTENTQIAQYWEQKANAQRVIARNRDFTAQPNPVVRDNPLWSNHFV